MTLLLGVMMALGGMLSPTAALAASEGPGLRVGGVFLGAFISSNNASNAFCVEPDGHNPSSEVPATEMTALRGYRMQSTGHWVAPYTDERGLRMMNYIASTYGTLGSGGDWQDSQAAAVALAIWTIRGWEDSVVSTWVSGIRSNAPSTVRTLADQFILESDQRSRPANIVPPDEPVVAWESDTAGTVSLPAGYERLTIVSGAKLTGSAPAGTSYTTSSTVAELEAEGSHTVAFEVFPTAESPRGAPVVLRASWAQSVVNWPARVWGFQPVSDTEDQLLIAGGGGETVSDSGVWDKTVRPSAAAPFEPVVTTQVDQFRVDPGEPYRDQVTFGVSNASSEWPRYWADDAWHARPVRATGTLYGPYPARPRQSTVVPDEPEAPIAGTAVIEAVRGPGTYDVQIAAPERSPAGYYTWVWQIDGAAQGPLLQTGARDGWHLNGDYRYRDDFGLPGETQVRPMELSIRTALDERKLPPGGRTMDRVTLTPGAGGWLELDGASVPVTVRATVYETDGDPVRAAEAPADAHVLSVARRTVTSAKHPLSFPVEVPFSVAGGVTVQVCVLTEDQAVEARDLIAERCDEWGIPAESAVIDLPEVTTRAQTHGTVDQAIHDVATIGGPIPKRTTLGFTAYLRPEIGAPKYDSNWRPVVDDRGRPEVWKAAELSQLSEQERCVVQPVATTARIPIERAGDYRSPDVFARSAGTVRWVEDLVALNPADGSELELHRGRCGAVLETTRVDPRVDSLSMTGGAPWGLLGGSSVALLVGAGIVVLAQQRRRGR